MGSGYGSGVRNPRGGANGPAVADVKTYAPDRHPGGDSETPRAGYPGPEESGGRGGYPCTDKAQGTWRVDGCGRRVGAGLQKVYGDDFQATLPLNSWHQRVLRTQAWLWRAKGLEPLTFWCSDLWDQLPLIGMPDTAAGELAG